MSDHSSFVSFTIRTIQKDDPWLKHLLEIPEEEHQSSLDVTIQLLPGSDESHQRAVGGCVQILSISDIQKFLRNPTNGSPPLY